MEGWLRGRALRGLMPAAPLLPIALTAMVVCSLTASGDPSAAGTGTRVQFRPAPSPVLWVDRQRRWVHQNGTVFHIQVASSSPRVQHWATTYAREWSARTVLEMRLVAQASDANVFVRSGYYGKRVPVGMTQMCGPCQWAVVFINLSHIRPHGRFNDAQLGAAMCQELGHVAGLWHGGGDCMSFTYHRTSTLGIGAGNAALVNSAYRVVRRGLPSRLRQ